MSTVIITDGKYRSAVAAVRSLGRAGHRVIVMQSSNDSHGTPPAFVSKYTADTVSLKLSAKDSGYPEELFESIELVSKRYGERPVLFVTGADTIAAVSKNKLKFEGICDFLIPSPEALDRANDKSETARKAAEIGIDVPRVYDCSGGKRPDSYPVIIKPRCGEKLGLKAAQRYVFASDDGEFDRAYKKMSEYDPSPVVQRAVEGDGIGISLVMDKSGRAVSAICHHRIREYPVTGGPSCCCEAFYDEEKVRQSERLLAALGYCGIAMVEYKGPYLLEINPRIWGSFPLTYICKSGFAEAYVGAASGKKDMQSEGENYTEHDYITGRRMKYFPSDIAASFSYLKRGNILRGMRGLVDAINPRVKEGLFSISDPKPFFSHIKNLFFSGKKQL